MTVKSWLMTVCAVAATSGFGAAWDMTGKILYPTSDAEAEAGYANLSGVDTPFDCGPYVVCRAVNGSVNGYKDSPFRNSAVALDGTTYFWSDGLAPSADKCYFVRNGGLRSITGNPEEYPDYNCRFKGRRLVIGNGTYISWKTQDPYYSTFDGDGICISYGTWIFNSNRVTSYKNMKICGRMTLLGYTGSAPIFICPSYCGAESDTVEANENYSGFELNCTLRASTTTWLVVKPRFANVWRGDVKFTGDTEEFTGYLSVVSNDVLFADCGLPRARRTVLSETATLSMIASAGATVSVASLTASNNTEIVLNPTNTLALVKYGKAEDSVTDLQPGCKVSLDITGFCSLPEELVDGFAVLTGPADLNLAASDIRVIGGDADLARFSRIAEEIDPQTDTKTFRLQINSQIVLSPFSTTVLQDTEGKQIVLSLTGLDAVGGAIDDFPFLKLPTECGLEKRDIAISGTDDEFYRVLCIRQSDSDIGMRTFTITTLPKTSADYDADPGYVKQLKTTVPYGLSELTMAGDNDGNPFWSDGQIPHSGKKYYEQYGGGRSPTALDPKKEDLYTFEGDLLVIGEKTGMQWKSELPSIVEFGNLGLVLLRDTSLYIAQADPRLGCFTGNLTVKGNEAKPSRLEGSHAQVTDDYLSGFNLPESLSVHGDATAWLKFSKQNKDYVYRPIFELFCDGSDYFGTYEFNQAKAVIGASAVESARQVKATASIITTANSGETVYMRSLSLDSGSVLLLTLNDMVNLGSASLAPGASIALDFTEADVGTEKVDRILLTAVEGVNYADYFTEVEFEGCSGSVAVDEFGNIRLVISDAAVAKVGSIPYSTLEGATAALEDGDTLTLMAEYVNGTGTFDGVTGISYEYAKHLGGYANCRELQLVNGAEVTVPGYFYMGQASGASWRPTENLTLSVGEGCAFTVDKQFNCAGTNNTLIVENGLVEANYTYPFYFGHYATVDGVRHDSANCHVIFRGSSPRIRCMNEDYDTGKCGISISASTIRFEMDYTEAYSEPVLMCVGDCYVSADCEVELAGVEDTRDVLGGEMEIPLAESIEGEVIFLDGDGLAELNNSLPDGCEVYYGEGNKTLWLHIGEPPAAVVDVDGSEYGTFAKAWAMLEDNSYVTLLDDIEIDTELSVDKDGVAIDLNGYTLRIVTDEVALTMNGEGQSLMIFDSSDEGEGGFGRLEKVGSGSVIQVVGYSALAVVGGTIAWDGETTDEGEAGALIEVVNGSLTVSGGDFDSADAKGCVGVILREGNEVDSVYIEAGRFEAAARLVSEVEDAKFIIGGSAAMFKFNASAFCEEGWHTAYDPDCGYYVVAEGEEPTGEEIPAVPGEGPTHVETEAEAEKVVVALDDNQLMLEDTDAYRALFKKTVTESAEGGFDVVFTFDDAVQIEVDEAINDAEVAQALIANEGEVTVATVPGLYYSVATGDSLDAMTEGDRAMATEGEMTLSFEPIEGESGFYQIRVNCRDKE